MSNPQGEVAAPQQVAEAPQQMDLMTAIHEVLKTAVVYDGVCRGLNQAAKALDSKKAHVCFLATNCDHKEYVKLIEALCNEHNIPLIKEVENKKLGEMAGLCKIDAEGNPRKVVGCSCVVISDWGKEGTQAHEIVMNYIKSKN